MTAPTDSEVAAWMVEEFQRKKHLYQEEVVWEIKKKFGDSFVYDNENGNPAISKSVLKEFRKLTADDIVWERGERCWRTRITTDKSGRQQD